MAGDLAKLEIQRNTKMDCFVIERPTNFMLLKEQD